MEKERGRENGESEHVFGGGRRSQNMQMYAWRAYSCLLIMNDMGSMDFNEMNTRKLLGSAFGNNNNYMNSTKHRQR